MRSARLVLFRLRWDVISAVVLIGLSFVPGVAHQGLELAELPDRPLDPFGVALIVIQGGAVALLRRWPRWALALTGCAFAAFQLLGFPTTFAALGLLVVLVGAGALVEEHRGATALIALTGYVALAAVVIGLETDLDVLDALVFGAMLTALWLFGSWLRSQAVARRNRVESAEREAIAAERMRIARELHDVVTHHVTAMVFQAEAGQYLQAIDPKTKDVLVSIADGGRASLGELRSLLGALDGEADIIRAPADQQIGDLGARARAAGQAVELAERGEPRPLRGVAGIAVVRIVQESITNAMKHARDGAAAVSIEYREREILIEVVSSGHATASSSAPEGRGIIGMRERVALVGGEFHAGPVGDRFVVRARVLA
ncbi:sensor histidine kinase [Microbacterium sp. NPDC058342]|uniref:sensor histidine kinase n=1 Tax=Microbacterium sp. NPDC058342 TaxID=3346454 RepID=UPI00364A446C